MPPLEVFLLCLLALLGLVILYFIVRRLDRKRQLYARQAGHDNLSDAQNVIKKRCHKCNRHTDYERGDVFDGGVWWCLSCWNEAHDSVA